MPTHQFNTGRIRRAHHDDATGQLDLVWDNGTVRAYLHVPLEVYRRLCSAPNPTSYWEDRIAEEYPKGQPMSGQAARGEVGQAPKSLHDLFKDAGDES